MAIFTIYQNHSCRKHHADINKLGWMKAGEAHHGIRVHLFVAIERKEWMPEYFRAYKPVASAAILGTNKNIDNDLERVFGAGNDHLEGMDEYVNFDKAHSISVGDLVRSAAGDFYLVAGMGFKKVDIA